MNQVITATFENGVLRPDQPLGLPSGVRVRVLVEPLQTPGERQEAWEEFDRLCEEISVNSGGARMTRDQLHERR